MLTFEMYQNKYHPVSSSTERFLSGVEVFKQSYHRLVIQISSGLQTPRLLIKISSVVLKVFSNIPILAGHVVGPSQFVKNFRDLTNFLMGMQSIDGLMHFKSATWKIILLNVSGLILTGIAGISLAELFAIDCTVIKTTLAAIPVFGVLPYGGLLHVPMSIMLGCIGLLTVDRINGLKSVENKIQDKINYWKSPTSWDFERRYKKYEAKIAKSNELIERKNVQLSDGLEVEKSSHTLSMRKRGALQKEINRLRIDILDLKIERHVWQKKEACWTDLEKRFSVIDANDIRDFRLAKENKWNNKLVKLKLEKKALMLSTVNMVVNFALQIFVVVAMLSGIGIGMIATASILVGVGSVGVSVVCGVLKGRAKKIETNSVKLNHYIRWFFV